MVAIRVGVQDNIVRLPPSMATRDGAQVLVVVQQEDLLNEGAPESCAERDFWRRVQSESLRKVWDNDEDAVYDSL
jgi:hypothetical protein